MAERPTKVWITHKGYHRYEKAERFGELQTVVEDRVNIIHTDRVIAEIQRVLSDAEAEDYLLLSGGPLISSLCVAYMLQRHKKINILFWDPLVGDYIPRENLDFSPIPEFHDDVTPKGYKPAL